MFLSQPVFRPFLPCTDSDRDEICTNELVVQFYISDMYNDLGPGRDSCDKLRIRPVFLDFLRCTPVFGDESGFIRIPAEFYLGNIYYHIGG